MCREHQSARPSPPAHEVAEILQRFGPAYLKRGTCQVDQYKVLAQLQCCRTAVLGGHHLQCPHCNHQEIVYHSCRNRHCPKCQFQAREAWLRKQEEDLLPVSYYHFVATLPHQLNPWIHENKKAMLSLFFKTINQVIQAFARDPQWRLEGEIGLLSVLHTWNQKMRSHFHIHNLIPAGVLQKDGTWKPGRNGFLFKKSSLAKAIRRAYLKGLTRLYRKGSLRVPRTPVESLSDLPGLIEKLKKVDWVVYLKPPFGGPAEVLKYLGRYTHRIAISNHRILSISGEEVRFSYLDRHGKKGKPIRRIQIEKGADFIAYFLSHVLPKGFMKIRYYGILGSRFKKEKLAQIRRQCQVAEPDPEKPAEREDPLEGGGREPSPGPLCSHCRKAVMVVMEPIPRDTQLKLPWLRRLPKTA